MRFVFWALLVILTLVGIVAAASIADRLFLYDPNNIRGSVGDPNFRGQIDSARPHITANTLDYYPWTGGHTQANTPIFGGKFRTGKHGFFVDFDLDNPPPKAAGEKRVILTGGSTAQGWGADNPFLLLHRIMGAELTKRCGAKVSVVNLAMATSNSYQNFIALNLWGHGLAPDLIVSLSGIPDNQKNSSEGPVVWNGYYETRGLTLTTRRDTFLALEWLFPGLMGNTNFGIAVRSLWLPDFVKQAKTDFYKSYETTRDVDFDLERDVIPKYTHALESIHRDFPGIPVALVVQPYMRPPAKDDQPWMASYPRVAEAMQKSLSKDWRVFDAHAYYWRNMADRYEAGDGRHLSGAKQEEFAKVLSDWLAPALCP